MMDLESCDTKDDLRLPEGDIGDQIKQAFEKDENGILVSQICIYGTQMVRFVGYCRFSLRWRGNFGLEKHAKGLITLPLKE